MSEHVVFNKQKLCFTEVSDFTDFQGIGSDPLYKRYDSVQAVMRTCISDPYSGFLAQPLYNVEEDIIEWYVDQWKDFPKRLVNLTGEEKNRYHQILEETVQHYRNAVMRLENEDQIILGGAMRFVSDDMIFCYDDKVVMVGWGMRYDTNKHLDLGSLMHAIPHKSETPVLYQIVFNPGVGGQLEGNGTINLQAGSKITADMVPAIKPYPNVSFTAWDANPVDMIVNQDMVFTAQYEKMETPPPVETPDPPHQEPAPEVKQTFPQEEKKKKKWFAAIWPWLWKILLALLILLLLLFLLSLLLRKCSRHTDYEVDEPAVVENPVPTSGDVEITLYWENWNDLDLYCKDPSGEELSFDKRHTRSGGVYEIDMNGTDMASGRPIEHIYWPTGGAPTGTYKVYVQYYSQKDSHVDATPYTIRIKYGDTEETYSGTVSSSRERSETYKFVLNTNR